MFKGQRCLFLCIVFYDEQHYQPIPDQKGRVFVIQYVTASQKGQFEVLLQLYTDTRTYQVDLKTLLPGIISSRYPEQNFFNASRGSFVIGAQLQSTPATSYSEKTLTSNLASYLDSTNSMECHQCQKYGCENISLCFHCI